ncbi:DUF2169 domain-containing protein [Erwinia sp. S63]|uniref:DUF2169 family type VI secretion system accessory protein n=1 Tax=Erwinia sp. S63 TaxID=2769341 RepID=UPI00190BC5BD|nr:DUF2169 domain-containing protein [Erwinia sp. S63]MBK0097506.1 DUF2169 domain-containing protein [Erwinia sp. S63]
MKIIKPQRISLITRPYRWQQQHQLGVTLMAMIDMGALPRLLTEQALWELAATELQSPDGVLDLGLPKQHPEFLASGYAFAPVSSPVQCQVRIQVGDIAKTLQVSGERDWQDDVPGQPQPFQRIPLDWPHAFGGAAEAENPVGMSLPQVEAHEHPITHRHQHPHPASFNAVPFTSPRRFALLGKEFDDRWMKFEYPGFARDTDWRVFNQAQIDQWWPDRDALPPGATWHIENMHPLQPQQQGVLPLWQGRCFITRLTAAGEVFEEIALRATTLHFFPHCERIIMMWQGCAPIQEDDAADVDTLLAALEPITQPRNAEYYQQLVQQRNDPERSVLLALRDSELLPAGSVIEDDQTLPPLSPVEENLNSWQRIQREQQRQEFAANGINIDDRVPEQQRPAPIPMEDLHAYLAMQESKAQQLINQYEDAQHQQDTDAAFAPSSPAIEHYRTQQANFAHDADYLHSSDKQRAFSQQAMLDNYRFTAHHLSAPQRMTPAQSALARQSVQARQGDCRQMDLTGADLSHLDLRGTDFTGALLENVDFSHCQLDGCIFSNAILTRAELNACSATECAFDHTALALAQCHHSDFTGSIFTQIECSEWVMEHCILDSTHIIDVMFNNVSFAHCRFQHATLESCHFTELTLQALDFSAAILRQIYFVQSNLFALCFRKASLTAVGWVDCQAPEIDFHSATLQTCLFVSGTRLPRADFRCATLTQCNLRETELPHAHFIQATLVNSDLSEADCTQADMRQMQASECQFVRTRFNQAQLQDSNFSGAFLSKALLLGCDLRGCNLFRADLAMTLLDGDTRFDDAWTNEMKIVPQREQEQPL